MLKVRPLVWRNTHPYLLADRISDLTPRAEIHATSGTCARTVALYGWLRGTPLHTSTQIHVPGVGDLRIKSIETLKDPCPLPGAEDEKRRKMSEKQKMTVYAPMSDVGGVSYDKDAVYINVPGSFSRGNEDSESCHSICPFVWC